SGTDPSARWRGSALPARFICSTVPTARYSPSSATTGSPRGLVPTGAPPGHGSKLARVLDTSQSGERGRPADPLHRALAEQLDELLVWDRAVRAETDDAVHQMRVTTRKIRSVLQAAPDSFGLDQDTSIVDELRELANLLGV